MAASLSSLARRTFVTAVRNDSGSAAGAGAHAGASKQWKMVSFLVAGPAIILGMVNAFGGEHSHARAEFIPYEHLRLRNKRFPWGEGQKSLFHNSHVNPLPDGYEEDDH